MSNQVTLVGRISSYLTHDHIHYGEVYYRMTVDVRRSSGVVDTVPVIFSDRAFNQYGYGRWVAVKGQYRSFTVHDGGKSKLVLFVFATHIELTKPDDVNDVYMEGMIQKPPVYRYTPLGREITDLLMCVPRAYSKYDIIPCVCWGKTARYVDKLGVGRVVRVAGRIQSRRYEKNGAPNVAYEVSVNLLESV